MKRAFLSGLQALLVTGLLVLVGCKQAENSFLETGINAPDRFPIYLTPADYNSENTYYLLNDDESPDVFFDKSQRNFSTLKPVQVTFDDASYTLQVRFYSPRALPNVSIWAKMDGYDEEFKLLSLEKLEAFQQLRVHLPLDTEDITAMTRSGKTIKIMANPHLSAANFTFTVESDSPYWQTLKSITVDWDVWFGRYDPNHQNWKYPLHACHAREGVAFALNLTYMFSTSDFADKVNGWGPLYKDGNRTPVDRAALIQAARNRRGICYGLVSGSVVGLGGGNTFGLAEYVYFGHYADDDAWPETAFHEFSHILGFGHAGNMTYYPTKEPGFTVLGCELYEKLCLEKRMPVYSRRFLHSRKSKTTYAGIAGSYHKSKHIIEDPELDEIDGGLMPQGTTDLLGNGGDPVSFTLDHTAVPGAAAATFQPKDAFVYNDTLYVVNDADKNYSVELFNIAGGKLTHLKSIREWTRLDGSAGTFNDRPNGVLQANGRIYVTHHGSRTEIFDARDQSYITCLGNGNWGNGSGQTVHAYDAVAHNGLVAIHDKRKVVFLEEAMIGRMEPLQRITCTENVGETEGTYGMAVDTATNTLYSTHPRNRIDLFDLTQIRESIELKRSNSFEYKNSPYALDFYDGRLFVSSNGDEKFCEVDPKTGTILKNHTTIGGITLQAPEKFCIRRGTLFIVDRVKGGMKLYAIPMSQLQ